MATIIDLPLRRRPLSVAEYRAMPESPNKCSLLDDVLIEEPPPSDEHQCIVTNLVVALAAEARASGRGVVRTAPYGLWLTETEMVQPDVLFVSSARQSIIRRDGIHGAPDLVIEILSPSTRSWDRAGKRERYQRRGMPELWLVDPFDRRVEIYRFAERRDGPLLILSSAETIETPLLPGFRLPVWRVFER